MHTMRAAFNTFAVLCCVLVETADMSYQGMDYDSQDDWLIWRLTHQGRSFFMITGIEIESRWTRYSWSPKGSRSPFFRPAIKNETIAVVFRMIFKTDANGNAMFYVNILNSEVARRICQYRSLWARIFTKIKTNFGRITGKKKHSWADVRPRSAWEKLSEKLNQKRRDSESTTGVYKQNQQLRHELRTERAREGLPSNLGSQCSHNGRWSVAYDGKNTWLLVCRKQDKKSWSLSDDQQYRPFLGEERRTSPAISRPLDIRRTHLISSRPPFTFIALARHEAGWP